MNRLEQERLQGTRDARRVWRWLVLVVVASLGLRRLSSLHPQVGKSDWGGSGGGTAIDLGDR